MGGAVGALGVGLLFLPLSGWSVIAVLALQVGYILDFSDGQVARLTGRSDGRRLSRLADPFLRPGGCGSRAGRERRLGDRCLRSPRPGDAFRARARGLRVLLSGAYPRRHRPAGSDDVGDRRIPCGPARRCPARRRRSPRPTDPRARWSRAASTAGATSPRGGPIVGELLIYPGAIHLLSLAVLADLLLGSTSVGLPPFRALLLAAWAALLLVHAPMAIRRGHAVIVAVEARAAARSGTKDHERRPGPER